MKISFVLNCRLYSKTESAWVVFQKRNNDDLNSGYVRKWKTFHCLENEQGLSYKKTPFMILIQENSLKFGIVVIVMLTIMLVIVFTIDFYSQYGPVF